MTGSSIPADQFTLGTFVRFLPDVDGPGRLDIFLALAEQLRASAWAHLAVQASSNHGLERP
jgi:hypothetical protein